MNPVIVKGIIIVFLLSIFYSLGSALYYLVKGDNRSEKAVKALTWRIGLSFLLFVLLLVAFTFGWIAPH